MRRDHTFEDQINQQTLYTHLINVNILYMRQISHVFCFLTKFKKDRNVFHWSDVLWVLKQTESASKLLQRGLCGNQNRGR